MVEPVGLETHWRGRADTFDRRVRWLVLVSVLVHTPLTPLIALLGVFSWIRGPDVTLPDDPPITAIPVDILEEEAPPPPPAPDPVPVAPAVAEPVRTAATPRPPRDAGIEDAGPVDAGIPDAGPAETDAGIADAGRLSDAGFDGGIGEPIAVSGDAKRVVDANANVRVVVFTEKIRRHALGPRIGRLLSNVYQWRDFFGPAALDPIRDVDRLLLVGPQFRDSSNVVAVLKVNVPRARLHDAIDAIVKADPNGEWLDAGVPAARAQADRAPRVFVLPAPGIVVVTPPSAEKSALALGKKTGILPARADEVASGYLVEPWKLTRGLPLLNLPQSLKWARVRLTPDDKGGGAIDVELEDESPELAQKNAVGITRMLMTPDLRLWALGFPESRVVERVELAADGARIKGTLFLSAAHVDNMLVLGETYLAPPSGGGGAKGKTGGSSDAPGSK